MPTIRVSKKQKRQRLVAELIKEYGWSESDAEALAILEFGNKITKKYTPFSPGGVNLGSQVR